MGQFTDDKPLPATPENGMKGITSSLPETEGICSQAWPEDHEANADPERRHMVDR